MELNRIICGDCIKVMKDMPDNFFDSVVTDPPYGLEFMGKEWDKFKEGKNIAGGTTGEGTPFGRSKPLNSVYQYGLKEKNQLQKFCFQWATECLRVLKPGGYLLSFGGTRTYHRMACAIEDAGFEIRDCICWLYGSGFPKSLNIGKAIDMDLFVKKFEKEHGRKPTKEEKKKYREVIGQIKRGDVERAKQSCVTYAKADANKGNKDIFGYGIENITAPATPEARQWEGWGTALKPAFEPIVVARKPLSEKTVALNVLKYGTGGINVDGGRIPLLNGDKKVGGFGNAKSGFQKGIGNAGDPDYKCDWKEDARGRFPANLILSEQGAEELDRQSGMSKSTIDITNHKDKKGTSLFADKQIDRIQRGDTGGASRFFYVAKASKRERNMGLENLPEKEIGHNRFDKCGKCGGYILQNPDRPSACKCDNPDRQHNKIKGNYHPTVKPLKLMEYLVKLVTPPKGTVLDPFIGSGTTAMACKRLGFNYIGIEQSEEYCQIAVARIKVIKEDLRLF